jgi:hypothetical protein
VGVYTANRDLGAGFNNYLSGTAFSYQRNLRRFVFPFRVSAQLDYRRSVASNSSDYRSDVSAIRVLHDYGSKTTVKSKLGQCVVAFLVAFAEIHLTLDASCVCTVLCAVLVGPTANLIEIWWESKRTQQQT